MSRRSSNMVFENRARTLSKSNIAEYPSEERMLLDEWGESSIANEEDDLFGISAADAAIWEERRNRRLIVQSIGWVCLLFGIAGSIGLMRIPDARAELLSWVTMGQIASSGAREYRAPSDVVGTNCAPREGARSPALPGS